MRNNIFHKDIKFYASIITILLFNITNLFSQNTIDPPKFDINFNDTTAFDKTWNSTHFIRAWNWSSEGKLLDEALNNS